MKKSALIAFALSLFPAVALADTVVGNNLMNLITTASNILNSLIPILIMLALIVFFWGLIQYIVKAGGEGGNGRQIMIAGIVALFIMVTIWGIIRLAQNTLGISGDDQTIIAPHVEQR